MNRKEFQERVLAGIEALARTPTAVPPALPKPPCDHCHCRTENPDYWGFAVGGTTSCSSVPLTTLGFPDENVYVDERPPHKVCCKCGDRRA